MEDYTTGTGQKLKVHDRKDCKGNCPIHNPSDHHMRDWPTNWRADLGIMERICTCGIGHPDPDDLDYRARTMGKLAAPLGVHGCCGCCDPAKCNKSNPDNAR